MTKNSFVAEITFKHFIVFWTFVVIIFWKTYYIEYERCWSRLIDFLKIDCRDFIPTLQFCYRA